MSGPTEIFIPLDDRTRSIMVPMYEAERKRGAAASDLMAYALSDASHVFQLIHAGLSLGQFDGDHPGLISVTSICAQHFRRLAENEGEHLAQLNRRLEYADPTKSEGEQPQ